MAAWLVGVAFLGQVVHGVLVIRRATRRGVALAGTCAWLWVGAVASWIALWSVTMGGTLGAL